MKLITDKLYKETGTGTPVFVKFGLAFQLVLLQIEDWHQELAEIRSAQIAAGPTGILEPTIQHGIQCCCCTKIVHESYTCPTAKEVKQRRHTPGRPRLQR